MADQGQAGGGQIQPAEVVVHALENQPGQPVKRQHQVDNNRPGEGQDQVPDDQDRLVNEQKQPPNVDNQVAGQNVQSQGQVDAVQDKNQAVDDLSSAKVQEKLEQIPAPQGGAEPVIENPVSFCLSFHSARLTLHWLGH